MSRGFTIAEMGKPVIGVAPVNVGSGGQTGNTFSMENYTHASIIIASGVITNETTVTVQECSNAGASATNAIGFSYYAIDGNGVTGARTTVDASGFATGTTDNRVWVIELDATQLTDGYPWVRVMLSAAATHAGAVLVVLSGARYAQANPPAAI